ncbi:MAG: dihydropteroate synthase [Candidatus Tectomicrobia bacterium]|nr:dihydropteroate synthase [Candidatus Tectomicrobia bacterium]
MTSPLSMTIRGKTLDFSKKTYVMGVLNVTPDSFSDGGKYFCLPDALRRVEEMLKEGADLIDVGGQSSRPGSLPIPEEEEIKRVIPVVREIARRFDSLISVDTYRAEVARLCIEEGADMINDISALRFDPAMVNVVAASGVGVVLMHMKGTPRDMQKNPHYDSVLDEISRFLDYQAKFAISHGVAPEKIMLDPGIGFGKNITHNLTIIRHLSRFRSLQFPILIGPSRKAFIGRILSVEMDERVEGSTAIVAYAITQGASMVRVHDVKEIVRVTRMIDAIIRGWGG